MTQGQCIGAFTSSRTSTYSSPENPKEYSRWCCDLNPGSLAHRPSALNIQLGGPNEGVLVMRKSIHLDAPW